jgi:hypothetical protein
MPIFAHQFCIQNTRKSSGAGWNFALARARVVKMVIFGRVMLYKNTLNPYFKLNNLIKTA